MRDYRLLVVMTFVLLAGCTGGSVTGGSVVIDDRVDRDCDGKLSSFTLNVSLRYSDSADLFSETDAVLRIEAINGESTTTVRVVDDLPPSGVEGQIELTGSEFPSTGQFRLQVVVVDKDLLGAERLGGESLGTVAVEPRGKDPAALAPTFDWSEPVKRGEEVTFVAADQSNSECTIVDYAWDFDGDGAAEQGGQRVNYTFESDGRHTVELTVENSRGIEKTISRELVVVFDPDGDGVTSAFERARGLDPRDADTDDDLFTDGVDPAPKSLLVPTGLLHGALVVALYVGVLRIIEG